MNKLVALLVMAICFSVLAQSDSAVVASATDNLTMARIIREGNNFRLIAWNSTDTLSGVIFSIPQGDTGSSQVTVTWDLSPLSVVGSVDFGRVGIVALASKKMASHTSGIVSHRDTLWFLSYFKNSGVGVKAMITTLSSDAGAWYYSSEKISQVKFWSVPSYFFISKISYVDTCACLSGHGKYQGTAIFYYPSEGSGSFKKEYGVYQTATGRIDSIYHNAPQDFDLMYGGFKVRILTDTGLAYFSGNLYDSLTAVKPKAASVNPLTSSLDALKYYDVMGRRITGANRPVQGISIIRLPNGVTVLSRLRYR